MRTMFRRFCWIPACWALAAPLPAQDPGYAGGVRVEPIETRVGEVFTIAVNVNLKAPIQVLAIRLQSNPSLVRFESWEFGPGLERYFEDNGPPPVCDIIVYPDGSGLFSVMAFSVPYAVETYGSDWLHLSYDVSAGAPRASCIFLQSDTEDYEPGSVERLSLAIAGEPRFCIPLLIRPAAGIIRGDADGSGGRDITDAIRILQHLFSGPLELPCADAADADDDGRVAVSDALAILRALFLAAGSLPPGCGVDASLDGLPLCEEPSC